MLEPYCRGRWEEVTMLRELSNKRRQTTNGVADSTQNEILSWSKSSITEVPGDKAKNPHSV